MMRLKDLFRKVQIRSGAFVIKQDCQELKIDDFAELVDIALSTYNRFVPHFSSINIDTGSNSFTTFNDQSFSGLGIPKFISEAVPIRVFRSSLFHLFRKENPSMFRTPFSNRYLNEKDPTPFKYDAPSLYLYIPGEWYITGVFNNKITTTSDGLDKEIVTIDTDSTFIKLVTGLYLQTIGRSRRAFTHTEVNITVDAEQLVAEGIEMEEKAEESLAENKQRFWLSWT